MSAVPVTTLHIAFYGIAVNDRRLGDLEDLIDRFAADALGIEEPVHYRDTHLVPARKEDA